MNQSPRSLKQHPEWPASAYEDAGPFFWFRRASSIVLVGMLLLAGLAAIATDRLGVEISVAEARQPTHFLYRDGPPTGFSGGFGEDNCLACHFGDKINVPPGSLAISAPASYSAGNTYDVTLTLTRPGMAVGGFQLTARFEEGGVQAGTLAFVQSDTARVTVTTDRGIQYAYHRRAGTLLTERDVVRWTLRWTAPSSGGSVVFHAAANAANEDDSQFGDFVYTATARLASTN